MNLQNKILKAIKEGLNTAFNFDDIVDALLDDIKTESVKNSAKSVKHKWLYHKLAQFVSDVLNKNELTLTLEEQNSLFDDNIKCGIYYQFPDNETFKTFIQNYCNINLKANLNWIDTSNITDMSLLFSGKYFNVNQFNGDISLWDVSNVKKMINMFQYSEFNGDISLWDVSSVTNMSGMFCSSEFNRDISLWDVSNVTNMSFMFNISQFNGNISLWNVSNVTDMCWMFDSSQFNGDISKWDVSSVTDMLSMFCNSPFNGDISQWDVSNVQAYLYMFDDCPIKEDYKPKRFSIN